MQLLYPLPPDCLDKCMSLNKIYYCPKCDYNIGVLIIHFFFHSFLFLVNCLYRSCCQKPLPSSWHQETVQGSLWFYLSIKFYCTLLFLIFYHIGLMVETWITKARACFLVQDPWHFSADFRWHDHHQAMPTAGFSFPQFTLWR